MPDQPEIAQLEAEAHRADVEVRILERQLGGNYRNMRGPEPPRHADYSDDEAGRARWRRDFEVGRRDWLLGRWQEREARHARASRAHHAQAAGVSRFIPGDLTLAEITEVNRTTPGAFMELLEQRRTRAADARQTSIDRANDARKGTAQ